MSALVGYARVSTADQSPGLQLDALRAVGCDPILTDQLSGLRQDRPALHEALDLLGPGDTLLVWRLDRLGRSLSELIRIVTDLGERGIHFRSLTEALDTSTANGRLVFHVLGALAEFERALIVERTRAGIQAARARGVRMGRRPKLTAKHLAHARTLLAAKHGPRDVARSLGVGRSTLYRALALSGPDGGGREGP